MLGVWGKGVATPGQEFFDSLGAQARINKELGSQSIGFMQIQSLERYPPGRFPRRAGNLYESSEHACQREAPPDEGMMRDDFFNYNFNLQ